MKGTTMADVHDEVLMPEVPTLEERVATMERILTALRGQQRDGVRLAESVDRLGLNAGALQEALLQVDRNQQALTRLGQELEDTKAKIIPRAEHDDRERERSRELIAYRRQLVHKIWAYSAAALVSLLAIGGATAVYVDHLKERNIQVCTEQNMVAQAQNDYLAEVVNSSTNPVLVKAAEDAITAHPLADCDALR